MPDQLRERLSEYLQLHQVGILATGDNCGIGALPCMLPVSYQSKGLVLLCWIPTWSDATYSLQSTMPVQMIIPVTTDGYERPYYQGEAHPGLKKVLLKYNQNLLSTFCDQYLLVEVQPQRLDLMDPRRGWGAREKLEF